MDCPLRNRREHEQLCPRRVEQKRDEMTRERYVRYYPLRSGREFRLVDSFIAGVNERLSDELASRYCHEPGDCPSQLLASAGL